MQTENPNIQTLLFAKEPELGFVKTRMQPVLSLEESLLLHKALTIDIASNLAAWSISPVQIHYWQGGGGSVEPLFLSEVASNNGMVLVPQTDGDLGDKMSNAVKVNLAAGIDAVLLLGADCPFFNKKVLCELFAALKNGNQAAIIPASDGGYVALALSCHDDRVFTGVNWGSDKVLAQTLNNFDSLGWSYEVMPELSDIDRPEDLQLLAGLGSLELSQFARIWEEGSSV